ncbi:hypothetical protein MTX35_22135 [Rhodococcus sp. ARC_M12]|uniref:hypothetical protein n=1 Tax=Rhodococcus sp. ARC_M12 TaxID=2928854 RepID=UPI001FB514C2|nr:hypothetical protein [Rhodococcus sp. ARC_M12]MCJ0980414.1 hypothetical protein [Rhodococcus sp. ARC_M12]
MTVTDLALHADTRNGIDASVSPLRIVVTAESCLVGALLWQRAGTALVWLDFVVSRDFADPKASAVVQCVRELAGDGVDPDPGAVVALIRSGGSVGTGDRLAALSKFVMDCYTGVPLPSNGRVYLASVLEESLRRTTSRVGDCLKQAADELDRAELMPVVTDQFRAIAAVRDRLDAASEKASHI